MSNDPSAPRRDLHAEITNQLIAAIEADPGHPQMPWHQSGVGFRLPSNAQTSNVYNGINVLALWCAAMRAGFASSKWGTYRQWHALGAQVRKGEKGTLVVFYKEYQGKPDPEDEDDTGQRRVAKASIVFNADQVDGFIDPEAVAASEPRPVRAPFEPIPVVEAFIAGTGARILLGGEQAFYDRRRDLIQLPPPESFIGTTTSTPVESFYAVGLHELGHWSGAPHRLNRTFGQRFGDEAYAVEELTAEIAAAFLCAELGVTPTSRPDHAQYLAHWLRLLKSDKKVLFAAAAKASEATRYLHTLVNTDRRSSVPATAGSAAASSVAA